MPQPPPPSLSVPCLAWRSGEMSASVRAVPEETAVAFTFNGTTHAVMMATPSDLDDFGVGFALTEGLIESPREIVGLDVLATQLGIELRKKQRGPRLSSATRAVSIPRRLSRPWLRCRQSKS
jgi:FdhD protein